MKKMIWVILLLNFSKISLGQDKLPVHAVQIAGGYSRHGSGDLNGVGFSAEYIRYYKSRFSVGYNIRGTINDGQETIILNNLINGTRSETAIWFNTAGVQVGADGRLSILRNKKHEFIISLGFFGRYQSAVPDGYSIYNPTQTGQPVILFELINRQPRETFAAGGLIQLHYNFTIRNKIAIGLATAFQTDTNGDAIPQAILSVARRF